MSLGNQLINKILPESLTNSGIKHAKGVFTGERNYKIACRFYYHFSIIGLKYERALAELNKEFDLSEIRIAQIIMISRDHLEQLKQDKADKKYLAKKLPHFNWS